MLIPGSCWRRRSPLAIQETQSFSQEPLSCAVRSLCLLPPPSDPHSVPISTKIAHPFDSHCPPPKRGTPIAIHCIPPSLAKSILAASRSTLCCAGCRQLPASAHGCVQYAIAQPPPHLFQPTSQKRRGAAWPTHGRAHKHWLRTLPKLRDNTIKTQIEKGPWSSGT